MIIDLVKYPILTQKSCELSNKKKKNRKYTFDVDLKLNKLQIKKLIQDLFKVKVVSVNTHRPPRKKQVLAASKGFRSRYKRVIITLKLGNSIPSLDPKSV